MLTQELREKENAEMLLRLKAEKDRLDEKNIVIETLSQSNKDAVQVREELKTCRNQLKEVQEVHEREKYKNGQTIFDLEARHVILASENERMHQVLGQLSHQTQELQQELLHY